MSLKEWKNKELFTLLSNKWGFGKNTITEEKIGEMHCGKRDDENISRDDLIKKLKDSDGYDPNMPIGALIDQLKDSGKYTNQEIAKMSAKKVDIEARKVREKDPNKYTALGEDLEEQRRPASSVKKHLDRVEKNYGAEVRVKLEDAETDEEALQIAKGVETRSPKATAIHFVRLSRDIRALQSQKKTKMNPDFMEEGLEEEKKLSDDEIAALEPPKDEITQADILKMRGADLKEGELELYGTGEKEEADLKGMEAISEEDDRDEELRHKDAAMDDFAHIAKLHKDMVYDTYKKYEDELLGHEKEGERYDDAERDDAAHMDYLGKDAHDDHEAREEEDLKESIRRHFKRLLK
jgi:hypothetical protein